MLTRTRASSTKHSTSNETKKRRHRITRDRPRVVLPPLPAPITKHNRTKKKKKWDTYLDWRISIRTTTKFKTTLAKPLNTIPPMTRVGFFFPRRNKKNESHRRFQERNRGSETQASTMSSSVWQGGERGTSHGRGGCGKNKLDAKNTRSERCCYMPNLRMGNMLLTTAALTRGARKLMRRCVREPSFGTACWIDAAQEVKITPGEEQQHGQRNEPGADQCVSLLTALLLQAKTARAWRAGRRTYVTHPIIRRRRQLKTSPQSSLFLLTASGLNERTTIHAKTTPEYPHETSSLFDCFVVPAGSIVEGLSPKPRCGACLSGGKVFAEDHGGERRKKAFPLKPAPRWEW